MLKTYKPILIVSGEPHSIFWEIFIKSLKYKKYKSPIIFIGSYNLLKFYSNEFKYNLKVNFLKINFIKFENIDNNKVNVIDIIFKKNFINKNNLESNNYINECFKYALKILKSKLTNKIINGPISKKKFLKKKYLGVTEYLAKKTNTKNYAMLIYNKNISVCPVTTHLPIKYVAKAINKRIIINKIKLLVDFYKNYLKIRPKIGVAGLNPHCESIDPFNEDEQIIKPVIKSLKKSGINISGPYSADTLFLKKNRSKFNIVVGMYHDQVLTPLKALIEFDAINITLGLPFLRISPDHGTNEKMIGKNLSNPLSLIKALEFLDK